MTLRQAEKLIRRMYRHAQRTKGWINPTESIWQAWDIKAQGYLIAADAIREKIELEKK